MLFFGPPAQSRRHHN